MRIPLSVLVLITSMLSGCVYYRETPPRVATTTTITCPAGTVLQSDGMCR